MAFKLYFEVTD